MHTRIDSIERTASRHGSIAPAIVAALFVSMAAIALALDRAWIDTAQVELIRTTEAAALAAARELATDDLLRPSSTVAIRVAAARQAAEQVSQLNLVVGQPLPLADGDVTFGKYVYNTSTDTNVFLETELDPQSVVVAGRYERNRANPIALVMRGFGGRRTADLARISVATLDNQLIGVRAGRHLPIPALPLAILDVDPQGARLDTWQSQIIGGLGADAYGYNLQTGLVTTASDGIPEMLLSSAPAGTAASVATGNMCLIDFVGQYDAKHAAQMIAKGLTKTDLTSLQSEISLTNLPPAVAASFTIGDTEYAALQPLVGECRICFLCGLTPPVGSTSTAPFVSITGLVAGRILSLTRLAGQPCQIVFQPAVIITRAAQTVDDLLDTAEAAQSTVVGNPYIYKLTLTQ
ncbi:MAG TPA: hypothetical protein VGM05_17130 [Planctomycetaceae bacterium]|jgi:hypothetical protein